MMAAMAPFGVRVVEGEPAIRQFLRPSFDADGHQVTEDGELDRQLPLYRAVRKARQGAILRSSY
jgi:hypothetical protein